MFWLSMRLMSDDERGEWLRAMRERARRDAQALTPRPGQPIYGLAAPDLTPAAVTEYQLSDEKWTAVTLTYGQPVAQEGPYVAVTTIATDAATTGRADSGPTQRDGPAAELRYAVEGERDRAAGSVGASAAEPSQALVVTRETLPAGPALVCRGGTAWAARLLPADPRTPRILPPTASR
jgi:hypothetical protein